MMVFYPLVSTSVCKLSCAISIYTMRRYTLNESKNCICCGDDFCSAEDFFSIQETGLCTYCVTADDTSTCDCKTNYEGNPNLVFQK